MARPVKTVRHYDASRRQEQARQTRLAILDVARDLFLERGYAATTVGEIAAGAGVSVETVYKSFANKAGLLKAVFDIAIAGDDEPLPIPQRDNAARIQAEPDGRKKISLYARGYTERAERSVPIQLLVRDAAASDAGAREVLDQLNRERLVGMTGLSRHLHESKVLRKDVRASDARDVLWLFTAPETYERLVIERNWSPRRFRDWITQQLIAALL